MKRFRTRFTLRSLMIAVALVGINIAGAIATAKHYPSQSNSGRGSSDRPRRQSISKSTAFIISKEGRGWSRGSSFIFSRADGTIEIGRRRYGTRRTDIKRIVLPPPPPTLLQIWSPLIASILVTILVLVVACERPALQHRSVHSNGAAPTLVRLQRLWLAARWLIIVMALVGLNLVAALYRPPPDPYDDQLESPIRSSADLLVKPDGGIEIQPLGGERLVMKPDGGYEYRAFAGRIVIKADGRAVSQPPPDGDVAPPDYGDYRGCILGTIVYKPNGSIVGYEGKPGQMLHPTHLIRPPTRSFLEMWWPVIASASITILVLGIMWRHVRRQLTDLSDTVGTQTSPCPPDRIQGSDELASEQA